MHRFFVYVLLLLPIASVTAQEKKLGPAGIPELSELGGSTDKATLVLNPPGHVYAIKGLFFRPDGKQLVSVGVDKTVQFWDVVSGERLKILRLPFAPTAAALSPDGKTLALGRAAPKDEKRVLLLNLDNERLLWLPAKDDRPGSIRELAFSQSGDQLAAGRMGGAVDGAYVWSDLKAIWDKTAPEVAKIQARQVATTSNITRLAFSPDGKRLALGTQNIGKPRSAYLVDLPVGDAKPTPPVALAIWSKITGIAWSPDGSEVVTVDHNFSPVSAVKFWSAADGQLIRQHKLGWFDGSGLHYLNAKQLLLTWHNDGSAAKGGLKEYKGTLGHGQSVLSLEDPIKEERKGPYLTGAPGAATCRSALSRDGKLAALTGGSMMEEIVVWEPATGKHVQHLGGKLATPQSVGWSKDGKSLGFGDFQDKDKKEVDKKEKGKKGKKAKDANPFFQHALDLETLQLHVKADRSDYHYRYRTNGDWALKHNSLDFGIQELRHQDKLIRGGMGRSWGFSPGGIRIYIAGTLSPAKEPSWFAYRMTGVDLAELPSGKHVKTLSPHPQRVFDLAPSPDGRYLISVNDQQVAFIYRIADDPAKTDPAPLLYLFLSHNDWIMWTKEGYYAASPNGERIMGWVVDAGPDKFRPSKLPTFYPAERFRKQLHRPDVIKRVLETGSVAEAVKAANAERKDLGIAIPKQTSLEKLLPPRVSVEIVQTDLPKVKIKVTAAAGATGQQLTALRLMIDGLPQSGPAYLEFPEPRDKYEDEWIVTLPGEKQDAPYNLTVLARGRDTSAFSDSIEVPYINSAKLPVLHVLAIGVSDYQEKALKVTQPAQDAAKIAAAFQKNGKGGLFREVAAETLQDKQANKDVILKKLESLRKKAKPTDLVVVFFAGHGAKAKDKFYLLPVETKLNNLAGTALSGEELRQALGQFPCQRLLMLDACHSAAGARNFIDDLTRTLTEDECGVAFFCSAMAYEKAKEGLFTQAVVEALEGGAKVPRHPRTGRHYLHHLHSYVFDKVTDESGDRQHPFVSLPWIMESFAVAQFAPRKASN